MPTKPVSGYGRPDIRFWRRVDKNGPVIYPKIGKCWVWTHLFWGDDPVLWVKTKNVKVHRFSYELNVGPIPEGALVCHRCDNPACVRPSHLFLGTDQDNKDDMVSKKRHPHGETSGKAVLTNEIVLESRRLFKRRCRGRRVKDLARHFGVSENALSLAVHRHTWKHLP